MRSLARPPGWKTPSPTPCQYACWKRQPDTPRRFQQPAVSPRDSSCRPRSASWRSARPRGWAASSASSARSAVSSGVMAPSGRFPLSWYDHGVGGATQPAHRQEPRGTLAILQELDSTIQRLRAVRAAAPRARRAGLGDAHADPGGDDRAPPRRPRRDRPGPDGQRQDRGLHAADPRAHRRRLGRPAGDRAVPDARAGAAGGRRLPRARRSTRRACTWCPSTAAPRSASRSTGSPAARRSSSARPVACSTCCSAARWCSPTAAWWCSTRPTRCSRWASSTTSARSCGARRGAARRRSSPPPCRRPIRKLAEDELHSPQLVSA